MDRGDRVPARTHDPRLSIRIGSAFRVGSHGPGQKIVGMVELVEASTHVHVANLVVCPATQRRGLGSLLLQFAESEAQRLRLPEVRLLMNCEMQTNRRFYERRGYVLVRTERIQGLDIAVMRKPVLAAPGPPLT